MTDFQPLLEAQDLGMEFPNGNGGLAVLERIDLKLNPQEFVAVVGPSGCGKTTMLRILGGLLEPTRGQVRFGGETLSNPRRRIGFVFQQANLMPWRTTEANISLPLELAGTAPDLISERTRDQIQLVGLAGFEQSYPRDLSGGMAQRVALARALIHDPEMLLLDEPFGSLDALTRERMAMELMRIWGRRRSTVVMVTHSISEALLLADRVLVLSQRPANVVLEISVDLARPRSIEVTHTKEFGELASRIRRAISGYS